VRIVFIFVDGLGIGENDLHRNPCAHSAIQLFHVFQHQHFPREIPYGGLVKPIDARLGVPGIPQSATGQATLLTGINAARLLNAHLSGFPNQKLRELLAAHSIHQQIKSMGKRPAFINVYRPIFFKMGPEALLRFLSVTSIANWKAGLTFFNLDHLRARQAIYHDFTNLELIKKGFQVPMFSPEQAGKILAHSSQQFDFCLYEYFKTDHAGHAQNMDFARQLLGQLERFVATFLEHTDLSNTLVLLTSDHGNIEDLSVKTHTLNPVPLIAWGAQKESLIAGVESLADVTPTLVKLLE